LQALRAAFVEEQLWFLEVRGGISILRQQMMMAILWRTNGGRLSRNLTVAAASVEGRQEPQW
jgi:hypothetical protein